MRLSSVWTLWALAAGLAQASPSRAAMQMDGSPKLWLKNGARHLARRDSTASIVKYNISNTDLSLWLYRNTLSNLPALNYASMQPALTSLNSSLTDRLKTVGDQALNLTNDDPLVWSSNATNMSPSQRLTIVVSNRPAGDDLTTNTTSVSINGLMDFLKQNSTFDLDSAFIVQNVPDSKPLEVGFIATLIGTKAIANTSSVPQNSTVTWPVPNNSSLEIRINMSDPSTRGAVDPGTMLDQFYDAKLLASQSASAFFNEPLGINGHNPWVYRKHSVDNSTPFDFRVSSISTDGGWTTLVNVLDGYAQAANASGLFYGSTFTVNDKSNPLKVLFNGTFQGNGTDPVPAKLTVRALQSSVVVGPAGFSPSCAKFQDGPDTNPNPFEKVMQIFSDPTIANFNFTGDYVTYYYLPNQVGGKTGTKIAATATFTACFGEGVEKSGCAARALGQDIATLRNYIVNAGSKFCGSVDGTMGDNDDHKFRLELNAEQNPSFRVEGAIRNTAPNEPSWAQHGQ